METEAASTCRHLTIPERIKAFLRQHTGAPHCDDCLAKKVGLKTRQHSQSVTITMAGTENFHRGKGSCIACGRERVVIRFARPTH